MEAINFERKQLLQQWKAALIGKQHRQPQQPCHDDSSDMADLVLAAPPLSHCHSDPCEAHPGLPALHCRPCTADPATPTVQHRPCDTDPTTLALPLWPSAEILPQPLILASLASAGMQRRDEALQATEEALLKQREQEMALDAEVTGVKKAIKKEEEKNEVRPRACTVDPTPWIPQPLLQADALPNHAPSPPVVLPQTLVSTESKLEADERATDANIAACNEKQARLLPHMHMCM